MTFIHVVHSFIHVVHSADAAANYQTTFNAETQLPGYGLHGYRPAYVALSADQTYCSVFKDDVVGPWVARHGMTSAQYQTEFDQQNAAGNYVTPDDTAFKAAAAGAQWDKTFYQVLTNQPGKDAWPITGATFILMHKSQEKPAQAASVLKFFDWAYKNGDKTADDLDYVPVPNTVKTAITEEWTTVKDPAGKLISYE